MSVSAAVYTHSLSARLMLCSVVHTLLSTLHRASVFSLLTGSVVASVR
jgi:hypothetical protein